MKFNKEFNEDIYRSKYMLDKVDKELIDPLKRIDKVVTKYYPHLKGKAVEYGTKKWIGFAGGLFRSAMNPNKSVSAVNCTTLAPPEDNLESISKAWYLWAKFAASGQGEGIDMSKLRPDGAIVHNASNTSTGPISFMRTFDGILKEIAQQGRRGASLISLDINHPDIPEFIKIKDEEGILETANISIRVNNKFMKAVENNEEWEFKFKNKYETISKKTSAKKLFRLIAEHAWKSGDPGLLFWDTSVKYSNSDYLGYPIVGVNAPVIGSTLVPTEKGVFKIQDLYENKKPIKIIYDPIVEKNNEELKQINLISLKQPELLLGNFKKYEKQQVNEIVFTNRASMKCNSEHRWFTTDGYKKTSSLSKGDKIIASRSGFSNFSEAETKINVDSDKYKEAFFTGWLTGDGWFGNNYTSKGLTTHKNIGIEIAKGDEEIIPILKELYTKITGKSISYIRERRGSFEMRISSKKFVNYINSHYGYNNNKYHVPKQAFEDYEFAVGFLRGLYQTDGSIDLYTSTYKGKIFFSSINENLINNVQKLLSVWFGITSFLNKRKDIKGVEYILKDGTKKISNSHCIFELKIPNKKSFYRFINKIGFPFGEKNKRQLTWLKENIEEKLSYSKTPNYHYYTVKDVIIKDEYEDMYCAVVNGTHSLNIEGLVSSNCSEQTLDYESVCMLSAINLAKFEEYGEEGYLEIISYLVFALDAFRREEIQEERSPSKEQIKKMIDIPRIGIGVIGLADYFIKKGISYGSKDSLTEAKYLFGTLSGQAYKTSYDIAKNYDKKSFPAYDKEQYKKSPFVKRLIKDGFITEDILDFQAHVCKTTVAPTGTGQIITEAGGAGIEPIFGKYYVRRERATTGEWKEWFNFNDLVSQELIKQGLEVNKENADNLDPEIWKTAHTINNDEKLELMKVIQKYIDSAVSVTYNLKEDVTVEEIEHIYMQAWKNEAKGVTVYREGSKAGVLITDANYNKAKPLVEEEIEIDIPENHTQKRPKDLKCDIHKAKYKGEDYVILVGMRFNRPWEIFVTKDLDKEFDFHKHKIGITRKIKKGQYSLVLVNGKEEVVINDIKESFDSIYGTLSRFISMGLRHHNPIQAIVEQLGKDTNFMGFARVVSRVLKKYIQEGSKSLGSQVCPECGNTDLIYQEGCLSCSCGWSKCS